MTPAERDAMMTEIKNRDYSALPRCEDMPEHERYASGHLAATPGCPGRQCVAVFDEWTEQAIGFQRVLESGSLDVYLGTNYGAES